MHIIKDRQFWNIVKAVSSVVVGLGATSALMWLAEAVLYGTAHTSVRAVAVLLSVGCVLVALEYLRDARIAADKRRWEAKQGNAEKGYSGYWRSS